MRWTRAKGPCTGPRGRSWRPAATRWRSTTSPPIRSPPAWTWPRPSAGGAASVPEWSVPDWLKRIARPREGWLSYLLLAVMLLSLAWSIQAAGWLPNEDSLVAVAIYASLLGTLLALLPLSVLATLPVSALVGAGVILLSVGGDYFPNLSLAGRLLNLRAESLSWAQTVAHFGYPVEL